MTTDVQDGIAALVADDPAGWLPIVEGGWLRIFARVQPGEPAWAVLAYEPNVCRDGGSAWSTLLVEMFAAGTRQPGAVRHPAGDMVIAPMVDDVELPGLRRLADTSSAVTLLRYRPHRRCTLRVDDDHSCSIVKVLADDRADLFHRDATELWTAAQRGELGFAVAEPLRCDSDARSIWQGLVAGAPAASRLLGPGGDTLCRRMGAALATLARSSVAPSVTVTSAEQLRRTRRAVEHATRRVPALAGDLHRIVTALEDRHAALTPDRLVPVHGAPHMHQWLIDDDRLGLIDFDRFALGEIELDIATLLTELDYEDEMTESPETMEHAVVAGFRSAGIDPDRSRLQLYRAHKRISKVTREAWALRTNGEQRARRHLPRIMEDLEGAT